MQNLVQECVKKLKKLSDPQLREVLDFLRKYDKEEISRKSKRPVEGEWFLIDVRTIKSEIKYLEKICKEYGNRGEEFFCAGQKALKFVEEHSEIYGVKLETYIIPFHKTLCTHMELRDMCTNYGDGQADIYIAFLELMMRLCNGDSVEDLFEKTDTLSRVREVYGVDGNPVYVGGSCYIKGHRYPPATFLRGEPERLAIGHTTSAYRKIS